MGNFLSNLQKINEDNFKIIQNNNRMNELKKIEEEKYNRNKRTQRKTPQKDVVFMPQPPTGAMATKMNIKTNDNRTRVNEIEAEIKNIKKPNQKQTTTKLITSTGLPATKNNIKEYKNSSVPGTLSAANPLSAVIQE